MTEWIITSSVLILVVIVLRTVLKGKISLRLQYALWALVLVRLLIPGSLVSSAISVMNVLPEQPALSVAAPPAASAAPVTTIPPVEVTVPVSPVESAPAITLPPMESAPVTPPAPTPVVPETPTAIPWASILRGVWIFGMAAMALWLIIGNLRFYLRLTRCREVLKYESPTLYVVQGIETPCLFGLLNPSVYVTPEVAADKGALAHVLAHEETHYHHKDHIWSLLRCICLVVHWYNPLVWLAAALSRRDSELACDEGAIRRLGEEQRAAYGRTLIGLTCTGVGGLLRTATTMTGSKKSIKERIVLIAKKPKMKLYTLVAVILIAVIAAGCTFTGQAMDFPAWVSTITLEDLDDLVTGAKDSKVQLSSSAGLNITYLDQEAREELLTILQGIQPDDFRTEHPGGGGTEGPYTLSFVTEKHENSMKPDGWWDFTCIGNGQLKVSCWYKQFKSRYGFRDVQYLDCPELCKFITKYSEPSRTEGEPIDPAPLWEDCAWQMVTEHAAALTAELGREVHVGNISGAELWRANAAVGPDYHVDVYKVEYFLLHNLTSGEEAGVIYGGVVRYDRYMFLLHQGGEPTLLGHMNGITVSDVYGTPEMLDQYSDMYTAAAMELYHRYRLSRARTAAILSTPNAVKSAFYDLNGDGVSEIIIKAGTCEADYEYVFYTYRNGAQGDVEPIGREQGGHSYLAISDDGALIIASGHMMVENAWRITWENGVFRSEWIIANRDAQNDGYTNWPKRLQTLVVNQGVIEEPRPSEPIGKSGVGLTVEAETAKAAAEEFFMAYGRAELLSNGAVADYKAQYSETLEISTDGNAVVGRSVYRVLPYEQAELHPDNSWEAGKGDNEGWYYTYPWFLLEKQADGLWLCTQWSTDDAGLKLSDFGYKNGLWGAIYGTPKAYRCKETDPQKAAETLVAAYVDDLTKMDNMRCFTITDYRNLEVSVTPTLEMSEADRSVYNYNLKDSEIGEDHWIVEFTMEYRWTGVLHDPPAGPGNGDYWMEQVHQGSPVGFLLTRDGDEFILRSRYPDRY